MLRCLHEKKKRKTPRARNACYKFNSVSMLHNCKYIHIFLWREATFSQWQKAFFLPEKHYFSAPIIPLASKDKSVDYVSCYVLLFFELQYTLTWGGLQTLVNININETIWGISSPENKLGFHRLCYTSSLNMENLPLTFN